jgi:hypothetical protein
MATPPSFNVLGEAGLLNMATNCVVMPEDNRLLLICI